MLPKQKVLFYQQIVIRSLFREDKKIVSTKSNAAQGISIQYSMTISELTPNIKDNLLQKSYCWVVNSYLRNSRK